MLLYQAITSLNSCGCHPCSIQHTDILLHNSNALESLSKRNENSNKHNYRNRASSRRSFLFVIPMTNMLFRASTPSICPAIPRFQHSPFTLASFELRIKNTSTTITSRILTDLGVSYNVAMVRHLHIMFVYLCKQLIDNAVMNSSPIPCRTSSLCRKEMRKSVLATRSSKSPTT